ncbi:MAG TPA: sulfatase-like hydrolase/transferase [Burkholderiales bacterium]|nr:sulfatase-like hydrolase/transferase [Burkholderiales bacterium]
MIGALLLDLAAWCALPAAFLTLYVRNFLEPVDAVVPHLRLVLALFVAFALLRLLLWRFVHETAGRLGAALAGSALLAVLLAYYVLVLVGLQFWGRVVSWDLIRTYGDQVPDLADALGVSLALVVAVGAAIYLVLFATVWLYLRYTDWTRAVALRLAKRHFIALALMATGVCALELYLFTTSPATQQGEPISLTFYPLETDLHGHAVDERHAAALDSLENQARAAYAPGAQRERHNLVLIIVDGLRPDHMGIYGYPRDTTPNLARLDRSGRLRKAPAVHAVCSSSVCGILGLASSRYVHQFSEHPITLHEVLRRNGYRVHALLSGDHTLYYGLKQVYGQVDSYYDAADARREHGIQYMNDDAIVLDRLAELPDWDGTPTMLHFHLMSAHIVARRTVTKWTPALHYGVFNRDSSRPYPADTAINYYDNGVLQADQTISALLAILERKGYLRDTLVALTADHGEAIGEHGIVGHTRTVHEESLRVPLVLISYGYRPAARIDRRRFASQIDIAPTLLTELGIPRPSTWRGTPLQEPATPEFSYFQERWEIGLFDLREPGKLWKYWVDNRTGAQYAFDPLR